MHANHAFTHTQIFKVGRYSLITAFTFSLLSSGHWPRTFLSPAKRWKKESGFHLI